MWEAQLFRERHWLRFDLHLEPMSLEESQSTSERREPAVHPAPSGQRIELREAWLVGPQRSLDDG